MLTSQGAELLGTGSGSGLASLAYFRSTAEGWLELSASLRDGEPRCVNAWAPGAAVGSYPFRDRAMILPELLANHLPVAAERPCRVVDLGCGSGAVSEALLHRHPTLSVIIVDREPVVRQAAVRLADAGFSGRFQPMAGDVLGPAPPVDADLVLLCNLLHSYGADVGRRLLARGGRPPRGPQRAASPHRGGLLSLHVPVRAGGRGSRLRQNLGLDASHGPRGGWRRASLSAAFGLSAAAGAEGRPRLRVGLVLRGAKIGPLSAPYSRE